MRKETYSQKKLDKWLFALALPTMFVGGMVFMELWFQESFRLLWVDVKSGFADAGGYKKYLLLFFFCFLIASLYLWNSLFGKHRWQCCFRLGKRQYSYRSGDFFQKYVKLLLVLEFVVLILSSVVEYDCYRKTKVTDVWQGAGTVGHSFGMVEEYTYTGSAEAFAQYYEAGQRTFEVDLAITSDNRMVLKHDWDFPVQGDFSSENIPTEAEFLQTPIVGKYTPLSLTDLCDLMETYPDVVVITDTKGEEPEQARKEFDIFLQTVEEAGYEALLDRFVIQVYNAQVYEFIREHYEFKNFIYTFYQTWYGKPEEMTALCRYCVNNGIGMITFQETFYSEEMQKIADRYGLKVFLHTVNEVDKARQYLDRGVTGVYTDRIVPAQLEK